MTFWLIGDEEHKDPRFTTASLGLYARSGSWCMNQVRYRPMEIPAEWFVPQSVVKAWGAIRQANDLVARGIWAPVDGGWRFVWIRHRNTTDYVRHERKRQATKKQRQRSMSPGDIGACPPGTYMGDIEP
jgi:hypothetical protein